MEKIKIAYIIPTFDIPKDRKNDLKRLLDSIKIQTVVPDQIIIVDASKEKQNKIYQDYNELNLTFEHIYPPSLASQRNIGVKKLDDNINIYGFIDDDVVLEKNSTEEMVKFWMSADDSIGGASFSIINQPNIPHKNIKKFFLLDSSKYGKVLRSGFAASIPSLDKTTEVEWLYGGATMWRRKILESLSYDEWFEGHGYQEDFDFSFRVKSDLDYKLFVVGSAKVLHHSRSIPPNKEMDFGKQQIINRLYIVKKYSYFSVKYCMWAFFGLIVTNFSAIILLGKFSLIRRLLGNFFGIFWVIAGRKKSFHSNWK